MILLIDSYDSFSHNLRRLLEVKSGKTVVTIFNDTFAPSEYENAFLTWIKHFDYIVVGPGPGRPQSAADVGIVGWLFRHFAAFPAECVPVLGVCLGFQSLCHEFGNKVVRLKNVKHGQVYAIEAVECDLFGGKGADLTPFDSVRYHSLHVDLTTLNEMIVPLATCTETAASRGNLDADKNGNDLKEKRVLMAGKHVSLPLYGVQYHPESICSSKGDELVRNFDKIAENYNKQNRPSLGHSRNQVELSQINEKMVNSRSVHDDYLVTDGKFCCNGAPDVFSKQFSPKDKKAMPIDVCDYLARKNIDFTFLNSAADPGQWCIIGLPERGHSEVITHSIDAPEYVMTSTYKGNDSQKHRSDSMWKFLAAKMAEKYISRSALEAKMGPIHNRPFPFLGGYMGILSYEEGKYLNTTAMTPPCDENSPDTKLVFIERFILYDRVTKSWFFISIKEGDSEFGKKLLSDLCSVQDLQLDAASVPKTVKDLCCPEHQNIHYEFPSRDIYRKQFDICQEYLHAGDSYELCLTTQSKIFLPSYLEPWDIYKVLAVHKNPSPYSSYMNFDDCVLISSSPERFLSWSDSEHEPGQKVAELRPIKGTVKNTEHVTLEDATKILRTPKEMGENLMIVDLIRHDLQSFTQDVTVDALMAVEEYKTVYQLVSVIRGRMQKEGFKGIDILSSSLPPGSMTGAPKKRSIELLQQIESLQPTMMPAGRRGLYSGVAGYWSVTDDADWSVTIRSIVNYKKDRQNSAGSNVWRIGAGGAITVLSEEEAEWEEMHVKLSSTLQTFL